MGTWTEEDETAERGDELDAFSLFVYDAFNLISTQRAWVDGYPQALSLSGLISWAEIKLNELEDFLSLEGLVEIFINLDRTYITEVSKQKNVQAPKNPGKGNKRG